MEDQNLSFTQLRGKYYSDRHSNRVGDTGKRRRERDEKDFLE